MSADVSKRFSPLGVAEMLLSAADEVGNTVDSPTPVKGCGKTILFMKHKGPV